MFGAAFFSNMLTESEQRKPVCKERQKNGAEVEMTDYEV